MDPIDFFTVTVAGIAHAIPVHGPTLSLDPDTGGAYIMYWGNKVHHLPEEVTTDESFLEVVWRREAAR